MDKGFDMRGAQVSGAAIQQRNRAEYEEMRKTHDVAMQDAERQQAFITPLEDLVSKLEQSVAYTNEMADELTNDIIRIFGPSPEEATDYGGAPTLGSYEIHGTLPAAHLSVDRLSVALCNLKGIMLRFRNL